MLSFPIWRTRALASAAVLACAVALGGCNALFGPPPEAVLAGTWQLEDDGSSEFDVFYDFNDFGRLTAVRYEFELDGRDATVTVSTFRMLEVALEGDEVTIRFESPLASSRFRGTINGAADRMEGEVTTNVVVWPIPLITLEVNNGPAALVRVSG
jgi:hypothetical protein